MYKSQHSKTSSGNRLKVPWDDSPQMLPHFRLSLDTATEEIALWHGHHKIRG